MSDAPVVEQTGFIPSLAYLKEVSCGEIIVTAVDGGQHGVIWNAIGGLSRFNLYSWAGLVQPIHFAGCGTYTVLLTDKGRALL